MAYDVKIREVRSWEFIVLLRIEESESNTTQIFLTQKDLVWFYGIKLPNQNRLSQRLSKLNFLFIMG